MAYNLTAHMKGYPFIEISETYKKYKLDWEKPSICYHINNENKDFKQCIKCGRIVFEKEGVYYFYFPNGVRYFIRRKK